MVMANPLTATNTAYRVDATAQTAQTAASARSTPTQKTETTKLSAKQGAETVDKALTGATATFNALTALQDEIRKATPASGETLDPDKAKALNDKIAALTKQIDASTRSTNGEPNLLSGTAGAVSVRTGSGVNVTVTAQALDGKALGLSDLKITDAASLREATAVVARAAAQSQLATFRLQAADGLTGSAKTTTSSGDASVFGATASAAKALAAQLVGSVTSTRISTASGTTSSAGEAGSQALAAMQKAVATQRSTNNATRYGSSGQSVTTTSPTKALLSLLA
jgi:hypothetical protein